MAAPRRSQAGGGGRGAAAAVGRGQLAEIRESYLENLSRHDDERFKLVPTMQDVQHFESLVRNGVSDFYSKFRVLPQSASLDIL